MRGCRDAIVVWVDNQPTNQPTNQQADVFVASESYFSTLVAVTSPAVKVVPLSASKTFFDRKLCNGMGLCAMEDNLTISDEHITTTILEELLLLGNDNEV